LTAEWAGRSATVAPEDVDLRPNPCPEKDVFPDLALILVPWVDHPCVQFDSDFRIGDELYTFGYYVAGQPLKLKATAAWSALDEAMEYLIQNTFSKMSYLKTLAAEPLKEIQAVLRCNDTTKEALLFQSGENNPQAIEDVRNHVDLCARANRQIVLHDLIEKRYALRPYGWPDNEVLLLLARMLILGDINLMMDGALLPPDKVFEPITTPAKRRKIIVVKRQTANPEAIKNARNLGKELFAEMGPDGEDGLFSFLQKLSPVLSMHPAWLFMRCTTPWLRLRTSMPCGTSTGAASTTRTPIACIWPTRQNFTASTSFTAISVKPPTWSKRISSTF
jgi:hypothetical protein